MGTFNAGAIKADLTLGRSAWTRDLKKTQKEIQDLERKSINIMIDADTDNAQVAMSNIELFLEDFEETTYTAKVDLVVHEAMEALERLDERLDRLTGRTHYVEVDGDVDNALVKLNMVETEMDLLESDPVTIKASADTAQALSKLRYLATRIRQIQAMDDIDIDVDVEDVMEAIVQMEALRGYTEILDGKTIDIDVDYDEDRFDALVGASGGSGGGHLGLLRILLYALAILSPVVSVAITALIGAITALAGALAAAAGAALVLGGGLALLIIDFNKAKKAGELTPEMQKLADALERLNEALDVVREGISTAGFELMAEAVDLLADILPPLIPIFNAVATAITDEVLGGIREFVESPEFNRMIEFFETTGVDMLIYFMQILGNLTVFFGRLFEAFEPAIYAMIGGLEDLTAGWAEWADNLENNEAFQDFMADFLLYGPMVLDMLGSMLQAFMNIGEALQPFAGPMLEGLTFFFDTIAEADPAVLTAIIGALAGLWLGLNVVAPLIGTVANGLTAIAAALGIGVAPLLLIVAGIAALGYAIYDLWTTNEEFRDQIIDIWEEIKENVLPIIEDFVDLFMEHWDEIKIWFEDLWADIEGIIDDALVSISQIIEAALEILGYLWDNFGDDVINVVEDTFNALGDIISGIVEVAHGIFELLRGVLTGDMDKIKSSLGKIWSGLGSVFRGSLNLIKTQLTAPFIAAKDFIFDRIDELVGKIRGLGGRIKSAAVGAFDGLKDAMRNALNWIIDKWNSVDFGIDISIPGWVPKVGGKGFKVDDIFPDVPRLAEGAFISAPTLALVGEGSENEIVAPESKMRQMVDRAVDSSADANQIATAVAMAIRDVLGTWQQITPEDLERLIEAASVNIQLSGIQGSEQKLAQELAYELRVLGYGGKDVA